MALVVSASCALSACIDPTTPGTLVPPTVTDDPALPRISVEVAGKRRTFHARSYGSVGQPVLMVLPGSASDVRAYEPLAALSDHFQVVMWDLRGNGLSERVPRDELGFESIADDVHAVRVALASGPPVSLLAHSWSAAIAARYLARYPDDVARAVLLEPPGLKAEWQSQVGLALDLLAPGYLDLVWSNELLAAVDHETLDFRALMMLRSGVRNFYCDADHPPPWPIWRAGGLAVVTWEAAILDGTTLSYDFTPGLTSFTRPVLIVGSSCSPIGASFQRRTNLTAFRDARLFELVGSGHRMLTEKPQELVAAVRAFLEEP